MTRNEKQLPTIIYYRDLAMDYKGHGVLISEDHQFLHITYPIGALMMENHPNATVEDLPRYSMIKADCEWFVETRYPLKHAEWIFEFPVSPYSADEIHHIGLFFEWYVQTEGLLNERLEKCIDVSLLDKKILKSVVRFVIDHEKSDNGLLKTAVSPKIQRILHQK